MRSIHPKLTAPAGFTFLTNHSHVLLLIARRPDIRMRELAVEVGITERAVQRIVEELSVGGYLRVIREGRRNRYVICEDKALRHPIEAHCTIGGLIRLVNKE